MVKEIGLTASTKVLTLPNLLDIKISSFVLTKPGILGSSIGTSHTHTHRG